MAKVISLNNYKGGSGKTFTSLNLSVGLANKGYKVLLIDFDPQGNSCMKFFPEFEYMNGINEVILETADINDVIYETNINNLCVIPSKSDLFFGIEKLQIDGSKDFLIFQLRKLNRVFDYIIIDNNPSFEMVLKNCILCADWILIPVNTDVNSIKGVDFTVEKIIKTVNNTVLDLNVQYKILLTRVGRTKKAKEYEDSIKEKYGDSILNTSIRYQEKAAIDQTSDFNYFAVNDAKSTLGQDYIALVDEIERLV